MSNDLTVHVIDDDEAMRDSIAFLLDVQGFSAKLYDSALSFLDALPVAGGCIVTDIRMPDMTGLELIRRLKVDGVDLPVIVMTGHGDVPLAVEAMKTGVIDFIEKPFSDTAFIGAVRAALASRDTPDADETPDMARLEARQKLADLSPREGLTVLAGDPVR